MTISDKQYPLCSKLGVLRKCGTRGLTTISTSALLAKVGWDKYKSYLPLMRHRRNGSVIPESCERWLATKSN